jgi:hypothetical protein
VERTAELLLKLSTLSDEDAEQLVEREENISPAKAQRRKASP